MMNIFKSAGTLFLITARFVGVIIFPVPALIWLASSLAERLSGNACYAVFLIILSFASHVAKMLLVLSLMPERDASFSPGIYLFTYSEESG